MLSSESGKLREPLGSAPERVTVDEMLQKYCGEFGRWQINQFLLISLCWIVDAFHTMVIIFADCVPDRRCITGCAAAGNNDVCGLPPGSWEWVGGAGSSTVSEWGLICGEKYKVGLSQAMFFVGGMIGDAIFGPLSDSTFGRKRSLAVVCTFNAIFGCLTAFSQSYWTYAFLRFLTGVTTSGNGLCAFVLTTEPIGPSKRGTVGMSSFYFSSVGIAILAAIAYFFQSWRTLYIVSSIPSFFVLLVLPFISESPRWYLVHGKVDKAMSVMTSIAESNGKRIPDGVMLALDMEGNDDVLQQAIRKKETTTLSNLIDVMIHSPVARGRLFLASGMSFMCAIMYYGLSLNVVNLRTNLYLTVVLNAIAEIPAALLNILGRKGVGILTFWFSGFFCLVGSLMSSDGGWKTTKTICGILGMFGMAGNYSLLYLYCAELFPTEVRNTMVGMTMQAIEVGAIVAPFLVLLGESLPLMAFAVCGIAGGVIVIFTPETLNKPLYDTILGMERGEA
ncbi:organic cation/carnitine transporter 4-like [Momordica charantia]|uniref:Organic cation/carnitine transporter 4-like n=1 Tax=Momordica charantia TaxID=3673 RepID=A0A6J1CCT7_MOMCH|nr:organic cation/carnitine transporter 4-like [Momordica charantia]XP_022139621.1 organic cation/carnitine transporter 4-like [Momordica charantia]